MSYLPDLLILVYLAVSVTFCLYVLLTNQEGTLRNVVLAASTLLLWPIMTAIYIIVELTSDQDDGDST